MGLLRLQTRFSCNAPAAPEKTDNKWPLEKLNFSVGLEIYLSAAAAAAATCLPAADNAGLREHKKEQ